MNIERAKVQAEVVKVYDKGIVRINDKMVIKKYDRERPWKKRGERN
jgi:hypothetical protein